MQGTFARTAGQALRKCILYTKMVPYFGFKIFHTTRMVAFLLLNFGTFLKLNGTIFVCDFWYFSQMLLFCCRIFGLSSIGTLFVKKFRTILK